jgi:hypothetical protein
MLLSLSLVVLGVLVLLALLVIPLRFCVLLRV